MSPYTLTEFDRLVLGLIVANPGASGFQLHEKLTAHWIGKSRVRKMFGWLAAPSVGRLYVSLARLEDFELVRSEWGEATKKRGWYRPRLYSSMHIHD